jgi:hypothetical protein
MSSGEAAGEPALVVEVAVQIEPAVLVEDQGHGTARFGLARDAGLQQPLPHRLRVRPVVQGCGDIGQIGTDIAVEGCHADHEGSALCDPCGTFRCAGIARPAPYPVGKAICQHATRECSGINAAHGVTSAGSWPAF